MEQFYKINDTLFAMVQNEAVVTGFTNQFVVPVREDAAFIAANFPVFPEAQPIYEAIQDRMFLETQDGMDFFVNRKTYKISAIVAGKEVDLDHPDAKSLIVTERKKMKDFLAKVKKAKESFKGGDRILLYWPTGTGKTYNFIEFLKAEWMQYAIVPVSEGMEDIDLMNYIVPTATGVTYKAKQITELLEKAEAGEKVCIIFDELNRGSNSLMNLVLKALDPVDGVHYSVYNLLQDRTYLIKQENIIWGATVNLWGKYTGTNALDEALFDRFNIVNFLGYSPSVELSLCEAVWFNKAHSKKILNFVAAIREFATSGELRSPISTRGIKVWMEEYMNNGNDLLAAFDRTLMYRLISVDEFGFPNEQELGIVKGKFQELLS